MQIDKSTANNPASHNAFAADMAAGLLLSGIALLLLFVLIPYGIDAPRKVKFAALHPAYYPRIIAWCLLIFGGATIGVALKKRMSGTAGASANSIDSNNLESPDQTIVSTPLVPVSNDKTGRQRLLPLAILSTVFAGVTFALPILGFPLTTGLTLLLVMPLAGEFRVWLILIVAICLPMLLYLFFTKLANIPIPGGVLDPWLLKL